MKHRVLSWLLVLAMLLSMLPLTAFAEGNATAWTKIAFEDILPEDSIAITMTKEGVTYALPTANLGTSEQPLADTATVSDETLTTAGEAYGWNLVPTEGGFFLKSGEKYLSITATNNGVRIGDTACVWTLIDDGYLSALDPNGTLRYLGVYAGATPDWRCYKAYLTGNIAGETLGFWKLDPNATPVEPTEPTEPSETEPSDPTEPPQPTEPSEPEAGTAELLTELTDGAKVYIYNPKNKAALTATVSGTQLAAVTAEVENDQLAVTEEMEALTAVVDGDGNFSFVNTAGEYLTYGDSANNLTFEAAESANSAWRVEAAEGGFYIHCANVEKLAFEYYKGNFTIYSFQSYNTGAYLMQFFSAGTAGGFTDTIAAGDRVVIYNPTNSMALSTVIQNEEKQYDFVGTELVLSGEELTGYTDENIWTVGANDDGSYTFTAANGQKLAVVNRTHIGFAEEGTAWTLQLIEGKTDEYFVRSEVGTYLEYYTKDSRWAAYYNPTEDMYAMRFYLVGGSVQPSNVVATPKASVKSGVIDAGTKVEFTCATEGATILYKIGEGEWQTYEAPLTITEDTVITVKAVMDGKEDSKEVTFTYTIYVPPVLGEKQAQLVTDVSELASGDQIIIVTKDYDYSLGITQKSNNRDYGMVVKAYDRCSYDEGTQIITLESGVEEGTFALYATNGDFPGYLYASSESGNLLRTQEGKDLNASFTISIATNGEATITSKVNKSSNTIRYNTVGIFSCYGAGGQKPVCIYKLDGQERPGLPEENDLVVIYNQGAKGVVSEYGVIEHNDATYKCIVVTAAEAKISESKAICDNGAFVFKVEKNGEYYRFVNESMGYLASWGPGLYTIDYKLPGESNESETDWTLEEFNGGYRMVQAHKQGTGVMRYCAENAFTLSDEADVTDKDTVTFHFYPCANETVTEGIVNEPRAVFGNLPMAYAGQKYSLSFTVEAFFGVKELKVMLGETELEYTYSGSRYVVTIPVEMIVGESLTLRVVGVDTKGVAINSSVVIPVNDEPTILEVTPIANAQIKDTLRPVISAKLNNVGEDPTVTMTVNKEEVEAVLSEGIVSYTPAQDLAEGRYSVTLTVVRADGKTAVKTWGFYIGEAKYTLMFGQLHSHTGEYSDGNGTLKDGLNYIANLPEEANVDFVAFTDHSNYFDTSSAPNPEGALFDKSLCTAGSWALWNTYKTTIAEFNASHRNVIAIPGFEMTWSGGPGHMNTFVTEGIVSRNNKVLNNKSADAGMRAYYELLATDAGVDSITQLNHPGSMFGNFTNFSYFDPETDTRVHLVEVGNGEGPIHGSGYYPSYEQYTLALDKGWHIAPTNNQDNHKGRWGNGNEARDVVLAESFSEEAIYEAVRNYRVYATEDRNLEIMYFINELPMGTIIESVPETLNFNISLADPDATDSIVRVELIVNSGKVAYIWDDPAELAGGNLTAELKPEYSYYFVRVTQADKDIAVTAPIWVGESLKVGLREITVDPSAPVTGEEVTIATTLYNDEGSDATVKSVVYTLNGAEVLYVDSTPYIVAAGESTTIEWKYIPTIAKLSTITVVVIMEHEGKEYTFNTSIELDVMNAGELTYVGIDASHNNEYVTGYNKDLMKNFVTIANEMGIRVELLTSSEALIAACEDEKFSTIILNAPSRRTSEIKDYSDEELLALMNFYQDGGNLIITGGGDSNDKATPHIAATQNKLLKALGSQLRLSDDGLYEGSSYALSFDAYGDHPVTEELNQAISYYGGSSIYMVDGEEKPTTELIGSIQPLLFANSETISKDADNDGLGGDAPKYAYAEGDTRLMVMAMEGCPHVGTLVVSGAAFLNDYDLKIPAENGNNALCEKLLELLRPIYVTDIAEVRKQTEEGFKFTIEGVATTNASGYDKETAFFDCIYVQDETGGINCFPVAGNYQAGDILRVTGTTDFYQGEIELQVTEIEIIGHSNEVNFLNITAAQLNDRSVEGMLVSLSGTVTEIIMANGLVESIYVKDEKGDIARVFIDGYITPTKTIENLVVGSKIMARGLASYDDTYAIAHDSYARIRVRDRGEIFAEAPEEIELPFTDVPENAWFEKAVEYVYRNRLLLGTSETTFEPETKLNRAMLITILYRMAGSPVVEANTQFTDVPQGQWFTEAVAWGIENGLVKGISETEFGPYLPATREQTVTFLYRYAQLMGCDMEVETDLSSFTDANAISDYALEAMRWAIGNGLVVGMDKNLLVPQGTTTRAQAATLIMRFDMLVR